MMHPHTVPPGVDRDTGATSAPRRHTRRGLEIIAAFKFFKAALLITAGFAALGLLSSHVQQLTENWLEQLALAQGHRFASDLAGRVLQMLDRTGSRRLTLVAVGAFAYAAIYLVEGIGLSRGRRWAEYLTVVVTLSFMPFEVGALVSRFTLPRLATLVLNVAVVIYLVWQLRAKLDERGDAPVPSRS